MYHLFIYILSFYFQTFNSVLLDIQAVELASTIDHVTLAKMNAVTWLACLDLLQKESGMQCVQKVHGELVSCCISSDGKYNENIFLYRRRSLRQRFALLRGQKE